MQHDYRYMQVMHSRMDLFLYTCRTGRSGNYSLMAQLSTCILIFVAFSHAATITALDIPSLKVHHVTCNYKTSHCRCRDTADVCVFNLRINTLHTLMRYEILEENQLGFAGNIRYFDDNGELRSHPQSIHTRCLRLPENDTSCTSAFTADGATYRGFISVNGQLPGPTLIVYHNQTVVANVENQMRVDTITVHWHGLLQHNTPWMDGMDHVSQCNIRPQTSFRYIFKAYPSGTFWYHSHVGTQRTDGLFGPFIILERNVEEIYKQLGIFLDKPENYVISVSDWYPHSKSNYASEDFSVGGMFHFSQPPGPDDVQHILVSPDGVRNGELFFWSALINGKGKHPDIVKYPYIKSRLNIFTVESGEVYRFRLIGASDFLMRFSIDEHQLQVIATDGYLIQPVTTDYIIFHSGERYDFLLRAKTNINKTDYWIRAELLAIDGNGYPFRPLPGSAPYPLLSQYYSADAILHYNTPGTQPPKSSEYEAIRNASIPHSSRCTKENQCLAVNCPARFHPAYYMNCTFIHELKLLFPAPIDERPLNEPESQKGREIFLNFASEGLGQFVSVNGRMLRFPSVPLQLITDDAERQQIRDWEFCSNDPKICKTAAFYSAFPECTCVYTEELPVFGSTNRLVLVNALQDTYNHPIHFHGHNFFVMDLGFPEYNSTTGFRGCYTPDLDCYVPEGVDRCKYAKDPTHQSAKYACNYPKWENGHQPSYGNPSSKIDAYTIRKDTVLIPTGGYVVIQFLANNPGYWFLHCHIGFHTEVGMAIIINEAPDRHNPPPPGMGACGNFSWSLEDYYTSLSTAEEVRHGQDASTSESVEAKSIDGPNSSRDEASRSLPDGVHGLHVTR